MIGARGDKLAASAFLDFRHGAYIRRRCLKQLYILFYRQYKFSSSEIEREFRKIGCVLSE